MPDATTCQLSSLGALSDIVVGLARRLSCLSFSQAVPVSLCFAFQASGAAMRAKSAASVSIRDSRLFTGMLSTTASALPADPADAAQVCAALSNYLARRWGTEQLAYAQAP